MFFSFYITAHPNVKVFISHCGLVGSQEALFHATPILGMPFMGDQLKNIIQWMDKGVARAVYWNDLSEDRLTATITDVITDSK